GSTAGVPPAGMRSTRQFSSATLPGRGNDFEPVPLTIGVHVPRQISASSVAALPAPPLLPPPPWVSEQPSMHASLPTTTELVVEQPNAFVTVSEIVTPCRASNPAVKVMALVPWPETIVPLVMAHEYDVALAVVDAASLPEPAHTTAGAVIGAAAGFGSTV